MSLNIGPMIVPLASISLSLSGILDPLAFIKWENMAAGVASISEVTQMTKRKMMTSLDFGPLTND
jgi:hypothetical protein